MNYKVGTKGRSPSPRRSITGGQQALGDGGTLATNHGPSGKAARQSSKGSLTFRPTHSTRTKKPSGVHDSDQVSTASAQGGPSTKGSVVTVNPIDNTIAATAAADGGGWSATKPVRKACSVQPLA